MPWLLVAGSMLALFVGAVLLLSELRWFSRRPLEDRLRKFVPGGFRTQRRSSALSVASFRDVLVPLAREVGERLANVAGVGEELSVRLERTHSELDANEFRMRQAAWMLAGFGVGGLFTFAPGIPVMFGLFVLLAAPLLAFLIIEQQLAVESQKWQRRVYLELPVVAEQLGMLLTAGYSLGGAMNRIAQRSQGACATDLNRVNRRVRQGLSEIEALREWSSLIEVEALDRLVQVLALNRETANLGSLISAEAQAIRRDVQREVMELAERRGQQVWIPVTFATLLPGVIFMAVPFMEALRIFAD